MDETLLTKLRLIESLQHQEQKVYERFNILIEKQVSDLMPRINQPELLNEMVIGKKQMMDEIHIIEEELSPLRKEIAKLSKDGKLVSTDPALLDRIKATDLSIIDLITKISRAEQELTEKIRAKMDQIKERLQHSNQQRSIKSAYQAKKSTTPINRMLPTEPKSTGFDTVG